MFAVPGAEAGAAGGAMGAVCRVAGDDAPSINEEVFLEAV